ncbi:MAG: hypothetical protein QOF70_2859, partial [Acetobacteraceae bacterium]|jgi:hypothetical protein|nr:hypothetical protein [Acetobacteraceae bacterium]
MALGLSRLWIARVIHHQFVTILADYGSVSIPCRRDTV